MSSEDVPGQTEVPLFTDFTPRTKMQSTAASLLCLSNYRLRNEATCDDPRLRILVGHIAVYDQARDWCRGNLSSADLGLESDHEEEGVDCDDLLEDEEDIYSDDNNRWSSFDSSPYPDSNADEEQSATTNELQDYLHQVPTFQNFQEAIRVQLATVNEVAASINAKSALEEQSYYLDSDDDDDDDTDYGSYTSRWDEEEDTRSDGGSSATDVDAIDSWSVCSSPVQPPDNYQLKDICTDKAESHPSATLTMFPIACAA